MVVIPSVSLDLPYPMPLAPLAVSWIPLVLICCVIHITISPI